jgi:hypothetical protein
MPRYYFDLLDDDGVAIDKKGLEFLGLRAVQAEAAKALAYMASDAAHGPDVSAGKRHMSLEVRDKGGPVMHVQFVFMVETLKQ